MFAQLSSFDRSAVNSILEVTGEQNPVQAIRNLSRDLVSKAFDSGWKGPPFNPFDLAGMLNIKISPNDGVIDARIVELGSDDFQIEYNPSQKPSRINFSIAHEIGHFLFPDFGQKIRNREQRKFKISRLVEFLCNVAASELLLPYSIFTRDANAATADIDNILELSNRYAASVEAVLLRFMEVTEKPCLMVIAAFRGGKLIAEYSKASRNFDVSVTAGFEIPKGSHAYECNNSGWTSKGSEIWDCFQGKKHIVHSIGLPPLRGETEQRVGILIASEMVSDEEEYLIYIHGDATQPTRETGTKVIAQVVNTSAGLGAGFGKAMAKQWPASATALKSWKKNKTAFKLGETNLVQLTDDTYVLQMLAQKGLHPTRGEVPLKYIHFRHSLRQLAATARDLKASVHMPRIGAGQAGGDWNIIENMIIEELIDQKIKVLVYDLPGSRQYRFPNQMTFCRA